MSLNEVKELIHSILPEVAVGIGARHLVHPGNPSRCLEPRKDRIAHLSLELCCLGEESSGSDLPRKLLISFEPSGLVSHFNQGTGDIRFNTSLLN